MSRKVQFFQSRSDDRSVAHSVSYGTQPRQRPQARETGDRTAPLSMWPLFSFATAVALLPLALFSHSSCCGLLIYRYSVACDCLLLNMSE